MAELRIHRVVDVESFRDAGVTDTATIQLALLAAQPGDTVRLTNPTYDIGATCVIGADHVTIEGPSILRAQAATQFEYLLTGANRTGVLVRRLTLDANKANRTAGQTVRLCGAAFFTSTECHFEHVTVRNTRGFNGVPAVGLAMSGGVRCHTLFPTFTDCGDAGNSPSTDSDGIFCSSDQSRIVSPSGYRVTDTVAVLEGCNNSSITDVIAEECVSAAGISNAGSAVKTGLAIRGVLSRNWGKANTGHVAIIAIGTGDLTDWIVEGVVTEADGVLGNGEGPIIYANELSTGQLKRGVIRDCRLQGSTAQGIVLNATDVDVLDCDVSGTAAGCIQVQKATTRVRGGFFKGGTFGVVATGSAVVEVIGGTRIEAATDHGVYAFGTSRITVHEGGSVVRATNRFGAEAGASVQVLRQVFDIRDYGAAPYLADNATAIHAADAAACSGALGLDGVTVLSQGRVYFPGGVWNHSALTYRGAPWFGDGVTATILRMIGTGPQVNAVGTNGARKQVSISDITFDGVNATSSHGIRLGHSHRSLRALDRVRIMNHQSAGIYFKEDCWIMSFYDVNITNCGTATGQGETAIYIDGTPTFLGSFDWYNLTLELNGRVGSLVGGGIELPNGTIEHWSFHGGCWESNAGAAEARFTDCHGVNLFGVYFESDPARTTNAVLFGGTTVATMLGGRATATAPAAGAAVVAKNTAHLTVDAPRGHPNWATALDIRDTAAVSQLNEGYQFTPVTVAAGATHRKLWLKSPANADTSGATLTQLETEVNELKAMLRAHGMLTA